MKWQIKCAMTFANVSRLDFFTNVILHIAYFVVNITLSLLANSLTALQRPNNVIRVF